jgi:predicted metalloprotease
MKIAIGTAVSAAAAVTLLAGCGSSGGGGIVVPGGQSTVPITTPTPTVISSTPAVPTASISLPGPSQIMTGVGMPTVPVSSIPNSAGTNLDANVQEFVDEFKSLQQILEQYWSQQIQGYVAPSQTLVFGGATDDPSTFPTCGGQQVSAENGFYCPPDNTLILDADWMYEEYTDIGDSFLYVVLAHEYGHSAQANLPDNLKPVETDVEVQADCFSGAFIQNVLDSGDVTEEEGDEQEINQTLATAAGDYGTTDDHGTLASRADAFEYGREHGPAACLDASQYQRR